jgi:hypothetical protein
MVPFETLLLNNQGNVKCPPFETLLLIDVLPTPWRGTKEM